MPSRLRLILILAMLALLPSSVARAYFIYDQPLTGPYIYEVHLPDYDVMSSTDDPDNHTIAIATYPIPLIFDFGAVVNTSSKTNTARGTGVTIEWGGVILIVPAGYTVLGLSGSINVKPIPPYVPPLWPLDSLDLVVSSRDTPFEILPCSDPNWFSVYNSQGLIQIIINPERGHTSLFGPVLIQLDRPAPPFQPETAVPEPASWVVLQRKNILASPLFFAKLEART